MWSIIIHGGAKAIAEKDAAANRTGYRRAMEARTEILKNGGNSVDAVEVAVRVLEDDPTFNAGHGSARNADGEVKMCAALMEGATFNVGAVAVAKGLRALEAAPAHVERIGGEAGGIVLTPTEKFGWGHNREDFAVAFASSTHPDPQIYLRKGEAPRG
ncbi:isoaspartyl peptidase/L-asparaginase [Rhizobium mesoamericanum]|uniref:isoaspartyl peptidase/L-asparaginase n=1 Tax=Rhizobium mesoamericanum TaxID=1079800 RepID=UPI00041ADABD|nr:isoaspartyl peptidase/L-asparaginase [Rhizobium mesoamericanum]